MSSGVFPCSAAHVAGRSRSCCPGGANKLYPDPITGLAAVGSALTRQLPDVSAEKPVFTKAGALLLRGL